MQVRSQNKYLVTILDLNPNELPYLKRVRNICVQHMEDWYGYGPVFRGCHPNAPR